MRPDQIFAISAISVIAVTILSLASMWTRRRRPDTGLERRLQLMEQKLEGIQQAIDAVAVETERISEGQRFTAKLLAESPRAGADGATAPGQRAGI